MSLLAAAALAVTRPPAVPLFTHNPYFSAWATTNSLAEEWPRHWTGATLGMMGLIRHDGKTYRFLGGGTTSATPMKQLRVEVRATTTHFDFEADGIRLNLQFCSPLLPDDLELLGRPVTYVTARATTPNGEPCEVYLDFSGEWVTGDAGQAVTAARHRVLGRDCVSIRAANGQPLSRSGDRVMSDWGSLYLFGPKDSQGGIQSHNRLRTSFANGSWPDSDDLDFPRPASSNWPLIGMKAAIPSAGSARFLVAYDEGFAIEYFHRKLRPYWRRNGDGPTELLAKAELDADSVLKKAKEFDDKLHAQSVQDHGEGYADMLDLAYRQTLAGHGLVQDIDGDLLMFSKENTSNGCIATVDVTYPASPFFLLFNPALLMAQILPVLEYASMPRWKFPFAPHDLGTYPLANGQVYGGGERTEENQMPVEESANMLLMVAGLAKQTGDFSLAKQYRPELEKWVDYLEEKGLDPENQLSTDDFTGHLAHNVNLSAKAILAIGAWSQVLSQLGEEAESQRLMAKAKEWAKIWEKNAVEGKTTRLAFDRPGTWSLKYNLYWDELLDLRIFSADMKQREIDHYKSKANDFGTPLDNRADFTKTDWLVWAAALGTQQEFRELTAPITKWLNQTPSRVGFTDWYDTKRGQTMGMHSRTVIGGVFARMLLDRKKK